jgi:hypothetical protein
MRKIRIRRMLGKEHIKIEIKNYSATQLICCVMSSIEGNALLDINAVNQERSKSLSLSWAY